MDIHRQAVTGVIPPQVEEALIREKYPSVARSPGIATLGRKLTETRVLAPLAWIIMSGLYFIKVAPVFMTRYALTNRRVMIRKGWKGTAAAEVPLEKIDDVKVVADDNSEFFRAANIDIIGEGGKVLLTLPGVPDPDTFKHAILNTRNAWVPTKTKLSPFVSASAS